MSNGIFDPMAQKAQYAAGMLRALARADTDLLRAAGLSEKERFKLNRAAMAITAGADMTLDDMDLLWDIAKRLPQPRRTPRKPQRLRTSAPPDKATVWGGLIRTLREERGVSQRHLADLSRVPRNTLRKIENGETSAAVESLERILDVLGYDLDAMPRDAGKGYQVPTRDADVE